MTDERRLRPNSPQREQPISDEELRAALERATDLSLRIGAGGLFALPTG